MGTILQYSHTSDTPFDFNDKNAKAGFHRLGTENSFKNAPSGVNPIYSNVLVVRNNAWDTLSMTIYLYTKGTNSSVVYKTGNTTDWANLSWNVYATKSDLTKINEPSFISDLNSPPQTIIFKTGIKPSGYPSGLGGNGCLVIQQNPNELYSAQLAFSFGSDKLAMRRKNGSDTWTDWKYLSFS